MQQLSQTAHGVTLVAEVWDEKGCWVTKKSLVLAQFGVVQAQFSKAKACVVSTCLRLVCIWDFAELRWTKAWALCWIWAWTREAVSALSS